MYVWMTTLQNPLVPPILTCFCMSKRVLYHSLFKSVVSAIFSLNLRFMTTTFTVGPSEGNSFTVIIMINLSVLFNFHMLDRDICIKLRNCELILWRLSDKRLILTAFTSWNPRNASEMSGLQGMLNSTFPFHYVWGLVNVGGFLLSIRIRFTQRLGICPQKNWPHLTSKFPSKLHGAMVKQSAQLSCIN